MVHALHTAIEFWTAGWRPCDARGDNWRNKHSGETLTRAEVVARGKPSPAREPMQAAG